LETDWGKPSSQRVIEYRNLAPASYRFEVSASNGNGLWTPSPAVLDITLQPRYWQTTWFRVLVMIAAISSVALIVRRRERMKARIKIELLKREQAVQEERARIARDLHDDVGSSLTHVALLSELAQGDLTHDPERAGEHINEIFTTAKKVTRSLDEIVWAVNPTHDTLEGFALFLSSFVQTYARTAGLKSRLDIPETLPEVVLDAPSRHHFYLATKEVLHNIVKHASATEIRLRMSLEPECLRLTIKDDGIGFSPDAATAGGDGLGNLRERLQQIGGTYTCRSAPGQGATVEMVMKQHFTAEQIGRIAD
jgi:signal transduction histidine kinase